MAVGENYENIVLVGRFHCPLEEKSIPRITRTSLAQTFWKLGRYLLKINEMDANSCLNCSGTPHHIRHLFEFECHKNSAVLTIKDLWTHHKNEALYCLKIV